MHQICAPVVHLREAPVDYAGGHDPLQLSQLIFGERVAILKKEGAWMQIEALEQMRFDGEHWRPYEGWVLADGVSTCANKGAPLMTQKLWTQIESVCLPLASRVYGKRDGDRWKVSLPSGEEGTLSDEEVLPSGECQLMELGTRFLGAPYLWGGCSAFDPTHSVATSVDCSGLVRLLYRACGRDTPRDAHDQYLAATSLEGKELEVGDLIFMAPESKPKRMTHVLLCAGKDLMLESTMATGTVRLVTAQERFGSSLDQIQPAEARLSYHIFFGRLAH